jgi:hypothetical protein
MCYTYSSTIYTTRITYVFPIAFCACAAGFTRKGYVLLCCRTALSGLDNVLHLGYSAYGAGICDRLEVI